MVSFCGCPQSRILPRGALQLFSAGPETPDPGKVGKRWEEEACLPPEAFLDHSVEAKCWPLLANISDCSPFPVAGDPDPDLTSLEGTQLLTAEKRLLLLRSRQVGNVYRNIVCLCTAHAGAWEGCGKTGYFRSQPKQKRTLKVYLLLPKLVLMLHQ